MPTTGSVDNITYTSTRTSDGQIVPTASGIKQHKSSGGEKASSSSGGRSGSSSSSSETGSSKGGALKTAMPPPGALGALGFAAMIAAL